MHHEIHLFSESIHQALHSEPGMGSVRPLAPVGENAAKRTCLVCVVRGDVVFGLACRADALGRRAFSRIPS